MNFCLNLQAAKSTCVSTQSEMQGFPKYFFHPTFFHASRLGAWLSSKDVLKEVSMQLQCFAKWQLITHLPAHLDSSCWQRSEGDPNSYF